MTDSDLFCKQEGMFTGKESAQRKSAPEMQVKIPAPMPSE